MKNFSILIPIRRKIEQLEIAIYNLREYSYNKNHEILLLGNCETSDMFQWLEKRKKWLEKHKIRYHHCDFTLEDVAKFPKDHSQYGKPMDGSATAMALNIGIKIATYDWIVAISDDDLFYSKDWDKPFFDLIEKNNAVSYVFRPIHVQPGKELRGEELTFPKFWGDAWRHFSLHRKVVPVIRKEDNFITEDEWNEAVEIVKKEAVDYETCGRRLEMHWIPLLIHRDLLERIKGWPEKAGPGFDLHFDDRLGNLGITKVRPGNSLVLHKGIERQFLLTKKGQEFIKDE